MLLFRAKFCTFASLLCCGTCDRVKKLVLFQFRISLIGCSITVLPSIEYLNEEMSRKRTRTDLDSSDGEMESVNHSRFASENPNDVRASSLISLNGIISKSFNPKKAFENNFISQLGNLLSSSHEKDFKLLGLSLDAGTKLYGSKVEQVYHSTQKVSSSLSMATENRENDENDLLDENDGNQNRRIKKRKPLKKINTIAANVELLNGKPETYIECDPLFYHLSANFDVGNANSLLLANLHENPAGKILLNSEDYLNFTEADAVETSEMMFEFDMSILNGGLDHENICPKFSDFDFFQRDLNMSELVSIRPSQNTNIQTQDYIFDADADVETIELPEDNFDFGENFANSSDGNDSLDNVCNPSESSTVKNQNLFDILPEDNAYEDFFNKNFLKRVFKNKLKKPIVSKKKVVRQKTITPDNIYEDDVDFLKVINEDKAHISKTMLSTASLNKWNLARESYEDSESVNVDFTLDLVNSIFIRDKFAFDIVRSAFNKNVLGNGYEENKENEDDVASYDDEVPRDDFDNSTDALNGFDGIVDFNLDMNTDTANVDLGLSDEPVHIDALNIDYAKVSKKIDIKKVKSKMWDIIQSGEEMKTVSCFYFKE